MDIQYSTRQEKPCFCQVKISLIISSSLPVGGENPAVTGPMKPFQKWFDKLKNPGYDKLVVALVRSKVGY